MQRYMPTFFQAADASEKWAGMKEDSEDGDWYHREDVDARITELENAAVASALRVKELEEMVLELEKECRGTCVFHIIKRRCESCQCPRSWKHS